MSRNAEPFFEGPIGTPAVEPPETRGLGRDGVRLLVSSSSGDTEGRFRDLPERLRPDDLIVVNRSATLPACVPARASFGPFIADFSTDFGDGLWLVEPRWAPATPGPVPLSPGLPLNVGGVSAVAVAPYPEVPRMWFLRLPRDAASSVFRGGRPIRYGYVAREFPLEAYQSVFGSVPGSAEMPSASRPFTTEIVERLRARGNEIVDVILHAGVSSLEVGVDLPAALPVLPEPFEVPSSTAEAVNRARRAGRRVLAVGSTVVRAIESVSFDGAVRPGRGFTRRYVEPDHPPRVLDGILSGFHDPKSSHVAMIASFLGRDRLVATYRRAAAAGFLWHEFGDSHLIWAS